MLETATEQQQSGDVVRILITARWLIVDSADVSDFLRSATSSRDGHGNGIPNSHGNPMGMGIKLLFGNGNGRNGKDGNGNEPSSHGKIPWIF